MESAIFGLIGVVLGAALTIAREWWFARRKEQKDLEYLAVLVVGQLDRFVGNCADVVGNDGLSDGQPDSDGYHRTQVPSPKFEPELLKVEWKALGAHLTYQILDLPYRIELANHLIANTFTYGDGPPDFRDGFRDRQLQYAILGHDAAQLATTLRTLAKLPHRTADEWNPISYIDERRAEIERERDDAQARSDEWLQI